MRLQEVYSVCKETQQDWYSISFIETRVAGILYFKLSDAEKIKKILFDLEKIQTFNKDISAIRKTSDGFNLSSGDIVFDQRTKNTLIDKYNLLKVKVDTLVDLFESFDYDQNTDGFDIKLPPSISLSDLSKCARDLDIVFSTCPLLSKIDGTISLSSVDVGSIWLSFIIGGAAITGVLTMVAALVDKALIIRSHHLTVKEQAEKIRALKMGNDKLESMLSLYEEMGKALLEQQCTELADQYNVKDPEDFQRLKNSLELLTNWMNKGMEIYAAVQAPAETKAVFPPLETQVLSEKAISLLEEENTSNKEKVNS